MPDIYDQHRAAFAQVSAYVIAHKGERVATIAFKFPRDGAGRLYAYVHWCGLPMVRGFAGGYGYDKQTAACSAAERRLPPMDDGAYPDGSPHYSDAEKALYATFRAAIARDGGDHWVSMLREAGFNVWLAV